MDRYKVKTSWGEWGLHFPMADYSTLPPPPCRLFRYFCMHTAVWSSCRFVFIRVVHCSRLVHFVWTGGVWFLLGVFHHGQCWGTVGHQFRETGVPLRARSAVISLFVLLDMFCSFADVATFTLVDVLAVMFAGCLLQLAFFDPTAVTFPACAVLSCVDLTAQTFVIYLHWSHSSNLCHIPSLISQCKPLSVTFIDLSA